MTPVGLFVGLSTFDLVLRVPGYPERNSKTVALDGGAFAGGPAANAAVVFAALGGRARLATILGRHALAGIVRAELEGLGVEILDLAPDYTGRPAVSSILVSDPGGDRTVASTAGGGLPDVPVGPSALDPEPDVLLTDSHLLGASLQTARRARRLGVPVALDAGSWKPGLGAILPFVDYAVCSEHFLPPGCASPTETMADLERRGVPSRAVTQGERPIRWASPDGAGEIAVERIDTVDTLGAGDFFHGAFCHALASGANFPDALAVAARVATLSCRSFGPRAWLSELRG